MVAKTGFDAMMKGEGDVVTGWHNKLQAAIAHVTPAGVLAEMHRSMAEPGTAKSWARSLSGQVLAWAARQRPGSGDGGQSEAGMNDIELAKALGLFSIGLGAVELVAARRLSRFLGLPRSMGLVRAFGAREVAAGLAVLTYPDSPAPLWARVGGDVLDLAVLASALLPGNRRRGTAAAATAAVLAVTVLDVLCATALTERQARAGQTARRTRVVRPAAPAERAWQRAASRRLRAPPREACRTPRRGEAGPGIADHNRSTLITCRHTDQEIRLEPSLRPIPSVKGDCRWTGFMMTRLAKL